jgi:hypothetical protein
VPPTEPPSPSDDSAEAVVARQWRARWVPRMRRGCAHGDLHGRNVLVGILRKRAVWPAIFDYEDMSPCNLLAWDFVKMETELKIRAFPELFPSVPLQLDDSYQDEGSGDVSFPGNNLRWFIRSVQAFEIELAVATEECHRRSSWPEVTAPAAGSDPRRHRLLALLLALRREAALHLGADRGRPREWLDEYYFLLACYGVSVVRFENLMDRERMGAYLSAGVAMARFLWNREE